MMQQLLRSALSCAVFMLFGAFAAGPSSSEALGSDCPLNPPVWLNVVSITPVSVDLDWADVAGAVSYEVGMYDETTMSTLPSVIVGSSQYTYAGLSPGHKYKATVASSSCAPGPFGEAMPVKFITPRIIIDDITQLSCPFPGTPSQRTTNAIDEVAMLPATNTTTEMQVWNIRVTSSISEHYVDFTVWADCDRLPHFRQTGASNGLLRTPSDLTETLSVEYRFPNGQSFFKISHPQFGYAGMAGLTSVRITYQSPCSRDACSGNTGSSPCTGGGHDGGGERGQQAGLRESFTSPNAGLSVAPNPFTESFQVRYALAEAGPVTFLLYDAMGRLVKTVPPSAPLPAGAHDTRLDVADLPPGCYRLVLQTGRERQVTTVVKSE